MDNQAELLKEDIECVQLFLDTMGAERLLYGKPMSIVGRIINLLEKQQLDLTNNIMEENETNEPFEPTELEHQQFMECQGLITHQIEVLNEVYKTIDSESIQKKIREKMLYLIDCL